MRTVKNYIKEKFSEDSDPITDMGIGTRALISKWMKEIDKYDTDDDALVQCAKRGKTEWVKFLLDKGADVHAENDDALQLASRYGHVEVVKLLLDAGADVHAYNNYSLQSASYNGHVEVVKLLLDAGADVHADNDAALHWASRGGHIEVVKLLLDAGANVHANNNYSLQLARYNGHVEVVRILKDHMNKIVKESLLEKFTEDSDPITDMGIGARNIIKNWYKKIQDLDQKLCKDFKFNFLSWDLSTIASRIPDEKDIKKPMLEAETGKLIRGLFLNQDKPKGPVFLCFVFYSNKIVYKTSSGDYKYLQKIDYVNDILEQLNLLSFLEFESSQLKYGTNEIKYEIPPDYVDYFKEGLKESLLEKFTEDSDPIHDMGIGIKPLIKKWLQEQIIKYPGYKFTYKIINDIEIILNGSLFLTENIPDYIQIKYIDGNVSLRNGVSSFKGLPNKINGYLSINSKDITSLDGAPNELNISVFINNNIDKEEVKKYVKRAADENRNISVRSQYIENELWTKDNIEVEKFLNESLFEKFTEDSDPIDDMGIGKKYFIEKWIKDNSINHYAIDSNFEITVEQDLIITGNLPDYIQIKKVREGSMFAKNITSAKGFPKEIGGLLQIMNSSLNTFDDVPADLHVTLFLRDVKFPEKEFKKYVMRAAKLQTHIHIIGRYQDIMLSPNNNYEGYI